VTAISVPPPQPPALALAGSLARSGVLVLAFDFALSSIPNHARAVTLPGIDLMLSGTLAFSGALVLLDWVNETGFVVPALYVSTIVSITALSNACTITPCTTAADEHRRHPVHQ